MKDIFCAFRDWDYGDFDIIAFETKQDMLSFCEFNTDYKPFSTSIMSLQEAKAIFEGVL